MNSKLLVAGFVALTLTACGSDPEKPQPTADIPPPPAPANSQTASSSSGWFGGSSSKPDERKGVAVNTYLWRASLATLSYAQIESADPFGGVIKTAWFTPANTPNERLKTNVFILDSRLRAEAIKVAIFKEVKKPSGEWEQSTVDPDTVTKIENIILDRARTMKIQDE